MLGDITHHTMNTPIHLILGGVFSLGLFFALFVAYRKNRLSTAITKQEVLRRSAVRLGFLTVPYLMLAWLWKRYTGEDVFFHGFLFWFAVILIPGMGFALDLWRLHPEPKQ